jgi:hypothetical protein
MDWTWFALPTERVEHEVKCWPPYFEAVTSGSKPFEVRKNDRGFQKGDALILKEWNPTYNYGSGTYTGRVHRCIITYVLPGGAFGIEPGYVVLGLSW